MKKRLYLEEIIKVLEIEETQSNYTRNLMDIEEMEEFLNNLPKELMEGVSGAKTETPLELGEKGLD